MIGRRVLIPRWIMDSKTKRPRTSVEGRIVGFKEHSKIAKVQAVPYRGTRTCHVQWLSFLKDE